MPRPSTCEKAVSAASAAATRASPVSWPWAGQGKRHDTSASVDTVWLPVWLPDIWLATLMFECSGPAAATGTSRAAGITCRSEAASVADDGFDAVPEACHAEPVVSQRADVWQAAAALPAPVGPPTCSTSAPVPAGLTTPRSSSWSAARRHHHFSLVPRHPRLPLARRSIGPAAAGGPT